MFTIVVAGHASHQFIVIPSKFNVEPSAVSIGVLPMGAGFLYSTLSRVLQGSARLRNASQLPLEDRVHQVAVLGAYEASGSRGRKIRSVRIQHLNKLTIDSELESVLSIRRANQQAPISSVVSDADLLLVYIDLASASLNQLGNLAKSEAPLVVILSSRGTPSKHAVASVARFLQNASRSGSRPLALLMNQHLLLELGRPLSFECSWETFAAECLSRLESPSDSLWSKAFSDAIKSVPFLAIQGDRAVVTCQHRHTTNPLRRLHFLLHSDHPELPFNGQIRGLTSLLAVSVAREYALAKPGANQFESVLERGLRDGLCRGSELQTRGYTIPSDSPDFDPRPDFGWAERLYDHNATEETGVVDIPDPPFVGWSIVGKIAKGITARPPQSLAGEISKQPDATDDDLPHVTVDGYEIIAAHIVRNGLESAQGEFRIPLARFGDVTVIDRHEFDGYWDVLLQMQAYRHGHARDYKPLSLAAFGPPGAGKSFGVVQLARTAEILRPDENPIEADVSQFANMSDLARVFHRARDIGLVGRIPLIVFDEFDSTHDRRVFGWLHSFLAPMQDGRFRDGESTFNIGRAIFVFVGGINHSFDMFCARMRNTEFIEAKGPDFISRLRGHIDVLGIDSPGTDDGTYMLRRAVLLRKFIRKYHPDLFNRLRQVAIDDDVLHALLTVTSYRHGVRSLESLVRMSRMSPIRSRFHRGTLPSWDQIEMHVDAAQFYSRLSKS